MCSVSKFILIDCEAGLSFAAHVNDIPMFGVVHDPEFPLSFIVSTKIPISGRASPALRTPSRALSRAQAWNDASPLGRGQHAELPRPRAAAGALPWPPSPARWHKSPVELYTRSR